MALSCSPQNRTDLHVSISSLTSTILLSIHIAFNLSVTHLQLWETTLGHPHRLTELKALRVATHPEMITVVLRHITALHTHKTTPQDTQTEDTGTIMLINQEERIQHHLQLEDAMSLQLPDV